MALTSLPCRLTCTPQRLIQLIHFLRICGAPGGFLNEKGAATHAHPPLRISLWGGPGKWPQREEKICYVAEDFPRALRLETVRPRPFELPDGGIVTLEQERVKCPEARARGLGRTN